MRLGPEVSVTREPGAPTVLFSYSPTPEAADLPPLELHPLVALVLAYLDEGKPPEAIVEHLARELESEREALHELVGDVGVVFRAHFRHDGPSSFVRVGETGELLAEVRALDRGTFRSRDLLFQGDRAPFPITLEWVVTRFCNRACVYCYQGAILNGKPKDSSLSTEQVRDIISQAGRLGAYNYFVTGGEPLLRRDSYDLLVHALETGLKPAIISKQFIREPDIERLAAAGLEDITLSIDSLDPQVAARLTGIKPYAERIAATVERLVRHGVQVRAKMVLTPWNLPTLGSTLEGLDRLGVAALHIDPYAENLQRHSDALELGVEQMELARTLVGRFLSKPDRQLDVTVGFAASEASASSGDHAGEHGGDCFVCHVGTSALLFGPDGRVGKCDKQLPGAELIVGDLRRQSVHEVWNSPEMAAALKPPRELYAGSLCYDCDDFDICHERARCHYDAFLTSGSLYGPGSNCPYLGSERRHVC